METALKVGLANPALNNLLRTEELLSLLDLFEQDSIMAVPYKGPTLAFLLHGDVARRQFNDLDILIRRKDLPRAKELLTAHGYLPGIALSPDRERAYLRSHYEYPFWSAERQSLVELQWGVAPQYFAPGVDFEAAWTRLHRLSIGGREFWTLAPEDYLLFLSIHGAKHLWERPVWVNDIAGLIRTNPNLSWHLLHEQAQQAGCERILLLALYLAEETGSAAVPERFLWRAKTDMALLKLAAQVRKIWLKEIQEEESLWTMALFHARLQDKWMGCLRYLWNFMIHPTIGDWESLPLPCTLAPLYYLIRPLRLAIKYLREFEKSP